MRLLNGFASAVVLLGILCFHDLKESWGQPLSVRGAVDFVVLRFDWAQEPPQQLRLSSSDGKSTLVLTKEGLFSDKTLLCDWSASGLGKKGANKACPSDAPIQDASFFGYTEESADSMPFTGIRILSIHGNMVKVPYKDRVYSGEIPYVQFKKVVPAKGGLLEKQLIAEKAELSQSREKTLTELGLSRVRQEMRNCLSPNLRPVDCLAHFLPGGSEKFSYNSEPGVQEFLSASQIHQKLKTDKEFAAAFSSCVSSLGPAFSRDGEQVIIRFDEDAEMYWNCHFIRRNGKWIFNGLSWSGC